MKNFQSVLFLLVITGMLNNSCSQPVKKVDQQNQPGGAYLNQKLPGNEPELFAPGIINRGPNTRDIAISPDGKEIFFCITVPRFSTILCCKQGPDGWSAPEVADHMTDPRYLNFEPCFSHDGKKLYFLSTRPDTANGETGTDQDIWAMDRTETGWGVPYNLGAPINTADEEYFPSLTKDGTIYFTRAKQGDPINYIYRSRIVDGKYSEPELLPENVNCGKSRFNATISPDESFIIVPAAGMPDTFGGTDYYISFRDNNDNWSKPVNMGPTVNTRAEREFSASLSPDGKYLFFMSQRSLVSPKKLSYKFVIDTYFNPGNGNTAIYWVDASFIQSLKSGI